MKIKVVIVLLLAGIAWIFYGVHTSIEAEKNLLALRCVDSAVSKYLESNEKWPTDWSVLMTSDSKHFALPQDVDEVMRRVFIDFTYRDTLPCNLEVDSAIRPLGPIYEISTNLQYTKEELRRLCAQISLLGK